MKNTVHQNSFLASACHRKHIHIAIIVIAGLLAYSNTFSVPFHFDDYIDIVENPNIRSFESFLNPSKAKFFGTNDYFKYYSSRIVVFLSFALNYSIHKLDVTGYHVVNLGIHLANGLLVYSLLTLLLTSTFFTPETADEAGYPSNTMPRLSSLIAFFTALLFIVHPIETQAVTYIKQRFASLATLFYLLSLVSYTSWRSSHAHFSGNRFSSRTTAYVFSLLCCLVAMKTKEIAFTLPFVLTIYEFFFFDDAINKRARYLLPFYLCLLIVPLSLLSYKGGSLNLFANLNDVTKVQTDVPRLTYFISEIRVMITYIRLIFFPANQNLDYDYPLYDSFLNPGIAFSLLALVLIGISVTFLVKHSHKSHRLLRITAFGIVWFFTTLSVESSFIPIVDLINEHRLYLPSIGMIMAIVALSFHAALIYSKHSSRVWHLLPISLSIIAAILLNLTFTRNLVWLDEISLWQDVVAKSPHKARGYFNLGLAYDRSHNSNIALQFYKRAVELDPYQADAHNNIGVYYFNSGLYQKAASHYAKALQIDPTYVDAYNNYGNLYSRLQRFPVSVLMYKTALSINPFSAKIHNNLGTAYANMKQFDKAEEAYKQAATLEPRNVIYYKNLAHLYYLTGNVIEAKKYALLAAENKSKYSDN